MSTFEPSRTPTSLATLALALALAGAVGCDRHETPAEPHDARVEAGLQEVLDRAVASPDVLLPGAITWYRKPGYAAWSGSAGVRELEGRSAMQPTSRVRAGSILKTLVATVALQLVEERVLSLGETLPHLLPASVTDRIANADRITLRMLLNHTSGIPEWVTGDVHAYVAQHPEHVWTDDEAIGIAVAQPASFEPGTSWRYSNTNYTLVGMVLDRAGGASWRAQVRARVLVPLGLWSTELPEPGDRAVGPDDAHGYQAVGGSAVELTYVDPSMAGAAGGNAMITSVEDLARFVEALLGGRLFAHAETLAEMTTMVVADEGTGIPHWYGLGVEAYELGGTRLVGNSGGAAGYATMMYRIPASDTTLVTTVNAGGLMTNAVHVLMPSLDVLAGAGG